MIKNYTKAILLFMLLCAATGAFPQAQINVRVTNLHYVETLGDYGSILFDIEMKKGAGYDESGGLLSSNLRWNLYLEPGVMINKSGVTVINDRLYNIHEISFQNTPMPGFSPAPPVGFTVEVVPIMIKRSNGSSDLPEIYHKIGSIIIPLAQGSDVPTDATYVTLRTSPDYPESAPNASSWSSQGGASKQVFRYDRN